MENRRTFTRILFSLDAKLTVNQKEYPVSLHDISISGALIKCDKNTQLKEHQTGYLIFSLNDGDSQVSMQVSIVHVNAAGDNIEAGLDCTSIDLPSISVLRRLIELNLGDEKQLNKELSELSYSDE